jgi:hypothetical protein
LIRDHRPTSSVAHARSAGGKPGRAPDRAHPAVAERFSGDLPPTLHLIGGEQIHVDGDRATGRWSYLAPAVPDGEAAWMAGFYDNVFVCQDGRWLFAHVRVRLALAAAHRRGGTALIESDEHRTRARG